MELPVRDESELMITGSQLPALSSDQATLDEALERCLIFVKIFPHQKLQIVEGLRKVGTRAITLFLSFFFFFFFFWGGSMVLAIRATNVGISVDLGTEIAKEATDVILLEKSLDPIVQGVFQGRLTCLSSLFFFGN